MEQQPKQPVHLDAFDLTPSADAIHEANRLRMLQQLHTLPPGQRRLPLAEPPIRRKTVPYGSRWINIVNR